jgi:hypothetical protein
VGRRAAYPSLERVDASDQEASAARCGVQLEREAQSNVVQGLKLMNIWHQI